MTRRNPDTPGPSATRSFCWSGRVKNAFVVRYIRSTRSSGTPCPTMMKKPEVSHALPMASAMAARPSSVSRSDRSMIGTKSFIVSPTVW
jgi:hypothetical protein